MPDPAPPGLELRRFRLGEAELYVFSYPLEAEANPRLAALSPAQRAVVGLASQGLSNKEIAARRGSSPQTVAKQLSRAYQKLGINSRCQSRRAPFVMSRGIRIDLVAALDAAYTLELEQEAWLTNVLDVLGAGMDYGLGICGYFVDGSKAGRFDLWGFQGPPAIPRIVGTVARGFLRRTDAPQSPRVSVRPTGGFLSRPIGRRDRSHLSLDRLSRHVGDQRRRRQWPRRRGRRPVRRAHSPTIPYARPRAGSAPTATLRVPHAWSSKTRTCERQPSLLHRRPSSRPSRGRRCAASSAACAGRRRACPATQAELLWADVNRGRLVVLDRYDEAGQRYLVAMPKTQADRVFDLLSPPRNRAGLTCRRRLNETRRSPSPWVSPSRPWRPCCRALR